MLPLALLRIRNTPKTLGLSPFELLYGRPFLRNDILKDQETADLVAHITKLAKFQTEICKYPASEPITSPPLYEPGDLVMIKTVPSSSPNLDPIWKGPFPVILSTPSAVKVLGQENWIHHSRVKACHPESTPKETSSQGTEE